jgi:hypothetical protein
MRILAALTPSMIVVTTTLIQNGSDPGSRPGSVSDRAPVSHGRNFAVVRGVLMKPAAGVSER